MPFLEQCFENNVSSRKRKVELIVGHAMADVEIDLRAGANESRHLHFAESRAFRFRGSKFARTNLRPRRHESTDKASTGHPGLRLSRQPGELYSDLSVTCCGLADESQVRCFRNGELRYIDTIDCALGAYCSIWLAVLNRERKRKENCADNSAKRLK